MALFGKRKAKPKKRRIVFLGIDGTPHSLVTRLVAEGVCPNLTSVLKEGTYAPMYSVYPTVSSVAWSCMMTGVNPARHSIYGFVDRKPGTYKLYIPTSKHMTSETLWEYLSRMGKRVVVMNVPVTYPPREVNGILVAGFLAPNVDKAVYPTEMAARLKTLGYRIDTDPWIARKSKDDFLVDFRETLAGRGRTLLEFMDHEQWDYLHCHIMETDRLHHFLWEPMERHDPVYEPAFYDCYRQIDGLVGEVRRRLDEDTTLIVMSDHGFCTLRQEVYINNWLRDAGYLSFSSGEPKSVADLAPESRAYSLDPGRVFINLRGREPEGTVAPGDEYEQLRDELAAGLMDLRDPESGDPMIEKVVRREEIYHGPHFERAADLVAVPLRGFDLKGAVNRPALTFKGDELVGMHTYDDAMLYVQGARFTRTGFSVVDVMPTILDIMELPKPEGLDGVSTV